MTSIKLKASGLTLIEMMLVITVFAVASLSVLKLIKNRATTQLVNSTVAQMQNMAQASLSYYMAKTPLTASNNAIATSVWPSTSSTPTSLYIPLVQDDYVSVYTLCTPFPGAGSTTCSGRGEIEGQAYLNSNYYSLVLQINSATIAKAIASKLPNATVQGNTITMTLTPPSANIYWNPYHGWIASAGVVSTTPSWGSTTSLHKTSTAIALPNCPFGFEGHIIFAPFRYQTAGLTNSPWGMHIGQMTGNGSAVDGGDLTQANSVVFAYNSAYAVNIGDMVDNYTNSTYKNGTQSGMNASLSSVGHLVYFLTICLPNGNWALNGIQASSAGSDKSTWPQDGQCSPSWKTFITIANSNYSCSIGNYSNSQFFGSPLAN